jgi:tetratricopeptide (TPR) repeat protein
MRPADPDIHYQLGFCYTGGCRAHSLLDPEIAIFHYRRALSLSASENTLARAMVLGALGNAYLSAPRHAGPRLLTAIHCYEEASEIYDRAGRLDAWAREQFNLGNAWCEMPEGEFLEKWERAIEHYKRALSIRTQQRDAKHYVATLQNLGTAYRELKTGDSSGNIRRTIECYHHAIRALPRSAPNGKRADLHHNLGNAYLTLAWKGIDGARNLRRAIRHLDRALVARTRSQCRFDYAATQFSRGQAYLQQALVCGGDRAAKGQARVCLEEARDNFRLAGRADLADAAERLLGLVFGHLEGQLGSTR